MRACTVGRGALFRKVGDGPFEQEDTVIASDVASLHAIWVDPEGGVWAAGGEVLTADLNQGILIYGQHDKVASSIPDTLNLTYIPELPPDTCPPEQVAPHPSGSIARRWNEQLLNSVRKTFRVRPYMPATSSIYRPPYGMSGPPTIPKQRLPYS